MVNVPKVSTFVILTYAYPSLRFATVNLIVMIKRMNWDVMIPFLLHLNTKVRISTLYTFAKTHIHTSTPTHVSFVMLFITISSKRGKKKLPWGSLDTYMLDMLLITLFSTICSPSCYQTIKIIKQNHFHAATYVNQQRVIMSQTLCVK